MHENILYVPFSTVGICLGYSRMDPSFEDPNEKEPRRQTRDISLWLTGWTFFFLGNPANESALDLNNIPTLSQLEMAISIWTIQYPFIEWSQVCCWCFCGMLVVSWLNRYIMALSPGHLGVAAHVGTRKTSSGPWSPGLRYGHLAKKDEKCPDFQQKRGALVFQQTWYFTLR
jgi:hypothetical protein